MSFRGFVHDVLVSVARVDQPTPARLLPGWLVSLTRSSRAFAGGSSVVAGRPVRRRSPARGGLAFAMAVVVAMLVIPTAFAWGLRDSVYEPGGVGGPALSTASPPAVSAPPNPTFPRAYDTRMVIPGEDAGRQRITGVDLRRREMRQDATDLTVTARTTTTNIQVGPTIRGANLIVGQSTAADCWRAVTGTPFAGDNVFPASQGLRFCLLLPRPDEKTRDLLVAVTVEDVAANGSITLRLTAWTITPGFGFATSGTVPRCTTLSGPGTKPTGDEVALFIRGENDTEFYYEQIVTFDPLDRWTAAVVIGGATDSGLTFVVTAVQVTAAEAAALRSQDGRPDRVSTLPGKVLADQRLTLTGEGGNC